MNLKSLWEDMLDMLYPSDKSCIFCNKNNASSSPFQICSHCWGKLPFIEDPICTICGKPNLNGFDICNDCIKNHHFFAQARAVFKYAPSVHEVIYRYKYKGMDIMAKPLGQLMIYIFEQLSWPVMDAIVPVPLHPKKQKQRGYNQSALLAQEMADILGLPLWQKSLCRVKDTPAQVLLGREDRFKNMIGAFEVIDDALISGRTLLLIDDILTTGATADACSAVLLDAGAKAVYVFTLATGIK